MARSTGPPSTEQMQLVEELWRTYRPLLYKFARGRNRGDAEADEIVSDTLLRLFRNADTLKELNEPQRVRYISRTVLSVAGDRDRRRHARERRSVPLYEAGEAADAASDPAAAVIERDSERRQASPEGRAQSTLSVRFADSFPARGGQKKQIIS